MLCGSCPLKTEWLHQIDINEINASEEAQYYGYRIASSFPYTPNAEGFIPLTWSVEDELLQDGVGGVAGADVYRVIKECIQLYGQIAMFKFIEREDAGPAITEEHIVQRFGGYGSWTSNPIMRIGKHPDGGGGSLAHASIAYQGYGADNFSDIHIDSDEPFDIPKLKSVLLHEMGHALGLAHSPRFGTLMYAIYTHPWAWIDEATVAGIQRIYPKCTYQVFEPETENLWNVRRWLPTEVWGTFTYPTTLEIAFTQEHEPQYDSITCEWSAVPGYREAGSLPVILNGSTYVININNSTEEYYARWFTLYRSSKTVGGSVIKFIRFKLGGQYLDDSGVKLNVLTHNDALQLSTSADANIDLVRTERSSVQCFESVSLDNIDDESYQGGYVVCEVTNPATGDELFIPGVVDNPLIQFNGHNVRIDLTADTTLAEIKTHIESIHFRNTNVTPFQYIRNVDVYVNDGGSDSNRLTRNINFTTGNEPARLQLSEILQYTESSTLSPGDGVILQDDNPTYENVVLEVYVLDAEPEEFLTVPDGSETHTTQMLNSHHARVTFGVGSTTESCAEVIRGVTYEYVSERPLNKTTTLKWELRDPQTQPVTVSQSIQIIPVNDPFTFSTGYGGYYMSADRTSKLIYYTQYIQFADIDAESYAGGFIRVGVENAFKDAFSVASGGAHIITLVNGVYTINRGTDVVGTVDGHATDTLTVSLTDKTTPDDIRLILGNIHYRSVATAGESGLRKAVITINDGHGVERSDGVDIRIYSIKDSSSANVAPTITHVDNVRPFAEGMRLMPNAVFVDENSSDMNYGTLEVVLENADEFDEIGLRRLHRNVTLDPNDSRVLRRADNGVFLGMRKETHNSADRLHIAFTGYDTTQALMTDICQMITYDRFAPFVDPKTFRVTVVDGDGVNYGGHDTFSTTITVQLKA